MEKEILKIIEPEATSSSHQAAVFSILKTTEEGKNWLINNYIQVYCLKDLYKARDERKGTLDYYYNEYGDWSLFEFSGNPLLGYSLIDYKMFLELKIKYKISVIDLLKSAIGKKRYIYIGIDKFYIEFYDEYEKMHAGHHLFINGFIESKKSFIAHDNFAGGKYCEHEISFDTLEKAFLNILENYELQAEAYAGGIVFLEYKIRYWHLENQNMFQLNIEKIIYLLKEYLMIPGYDNKFKYIKNYSFGMEVYEELINLIKNNGIKEGKDVDFRAFCCLRDHKRIMILRLENIQNHLNLNLERQIYEMKVIEREITQVIMMFIKYNLVKRKTILSRALEFFWEIRNKEYIVLFQVIRRVEENI